MLLITPCTDVNYTFHDSGRPIGKEPSSDPIGEFSSPPKDAALSSINRHLAPASTAALLNCDASPFRSVPGKQPKAYLLKPMASLGDIDSDSDALLEVEELVSKQQQSRAHVPKSLLEKKKRLLLAQQAAKSAVSDDDDDEGDLEVVPAREMQALVKEEEGERKSGRKKRISEGRKRQLNLGVIRPERQRAKGTSLIMTQGELNKTLVQRVVNVNKELTKKKEEEWVQRGGKVVGTMGELTRDASAAYAEKGLQVASNCGVAMETDSDKDGDSDEDWTPEMRGSASPSPQPDDGQEGYDENQAIGEDQEADVTIVNPESEVPAMDDGFDDIQLLKVLPRRRALAVVDSDSDDGNEETVFPIPKSTPRAFGSPQDHNNENTILYIPVPSMGSLSSTEERTEDENDKENDTSLMFDRSEDKENKAVVRHGDTGAKHPPRTRTSSLFHLEREIARGLSMSPVSIDGDDDAKNEDGRRPLKDLLDDDPFASQDASKLTTSFTARLQQASPAASIAPFIVKDGDCLQFSQELSGSGGEPLQPGFSDLFESGTEKQVSTLFNRPAGGLSLSESLLDRVRTRGAL